MSGHRITSIAVRSTGADSTGLKGQHFEQALDGADLIVGPNGAGKTTRGPLGVTALIEGLATVPTDPRRPWLGTLPAETTITAEVHTPSGPRTVTRDLSAVRGKAVEAANQAAREAIGIPPTAWDLSDFASGTGGDRAAILDAVARAGGALHQWDAETAAGRVEESLIAALPEGVDREQWIATWIECRWHYQGAPDGATLLRSALDWATDRQKTANADQKAAKGHAEELGAALPPDPGGDPSTDDAEARRLTRTLDDSTDHATARATALATLARHTSEGTRLRDHQAAALAEGQRLAVPLVARIPEVPESVCERLRAARAALSAPIEPVAGPDIGALTAAAHQALEAFRVASGVAAAALDAEKATFASLQSEIAVRAQCDRRRALVAAEAAQLDSQSDESVCVHCGQPDPLGAASRRSNAQSRLVEAADSAREAEARESHAARIARDAAAARMDADRAARVAADADARAAAELAVAERAASAHEPAVRAARKRAVDDAESELRRAEVAATAATAAHQKAEADRTEALVAARGRWKAATAALAEWETLPVPVVPAPRDESATESARTALALVEGRIEARRRIEDHRALIVAALARYETSRIHWDASRALLTAIRAVRDELADAAYRPIHDTARAILAGAPGLPQPYFRGPDDYGAEVSGHGPVPYAGLSESEQRITASAIVAALAAVAGNPCRLVLLDGLEVVQRDHRAPLLRALVEARSAGVIDQVIATMATSPGETLDDLAIDGLKIHRLDPWTVDAPTPVSDPAPQPPTAPKRAAKKTTHTATAPVVADDCPF